MSVIHSVIFDELELVDETTSDEDTHWICCDLPDDYAGFTMTFCGKQILEDGNVQTSSSVTCKECTRISKKNFCPLGHRCRSACTR